MLYRITVKRSKNLNGVRIVPGMTVDVAGYRLIDPLFLNNGQAIVDAFKRIYGIDIKQVGALNRFYLDIEKLS